LIWAYILEFELVAELGDEQFCTHEARNASRYGLIRFNFDRLRLQRRLHSLALDDFVEVVADWMQSFTPYRRYYKEGASDLPTRFPRTQQRLITSNLMLRSC
jgi:hypothetical protein